MVVTRMGIFKSTTLLCLAVLATSSYCQELNFVELSSTNGVDRQEVEQTDNGVSQVILTNRFPFGNRLHNRVYIGVNGYFSFSDPFYNPESQQFPGLTTDVSTAYLVAPFWDDIDLRRRGNIFYEIHTPETSQSLLTQVSSFVSNGSFSGTWMLVAQWNQVHPWPDGFDDEERNLIRSILGIDFNLVNTFQGVLISDGSESYTVFTYKCGLMEWTIFGATIGYNAGGDYFENHPNTGSPFASEIACLNSNNSVWNNVVYKLSRDGTATPAPPPTSEPAQSRYLEYVPTNDQWIALPRCRNCSSEPIPLGSPGIAFGGYYHTSVYVGSNGIFSFGRNFTQNSPALFPSGKGPVYFSYLVAPFWSDIDTRAEGSVQYKTYVSANTSEAVVIDMVVDLISSENGSISNANWMLVATWSDVHLFPHGADDQRNRQDPFLQLTNTFQGIIISNGTKTYSVFTYNYNDMGWSDAAVIGFNAGGQFFQNHPLGGTQSANLIGCVHQTVGSDWNNVVFNLSPGEVTLDPTPPPQNFLGTCAAANHTECCNLNFDTCYGFPRDCFCDTICTNVGDCCVDQPTLCQHNNIPLTNSSYLLYADNFYVGRLSLDGERFQTLPLSVLSGAGFLDFDYVRGYLYWYDFLQDGIFRSFLNGTNPIRLVNSTQYGAVEGIALDWVNNKLYWTETLYRRIEVIDLDTMMISPILTVDLHSGVRGIAVDPINGYMYWTDWGDPAKIERASMDGTNRQTLHNTGVGQPNDITIDYETQTIYWTDSQLGVIEYSNVDGTNRQILQSNLPYAFGVTVHGSLIFFTDWLDRGIHTAHKINQGNVTKYTNAFTIRPTGIVVVAANRQPEGVNYCDGIMCEHLCLLSTNAQRYSCACYEGFTLDANGQNCTFTGTQSPPPINGSCQATGYTGCCNGGYCAGSPPTCFCDAFCHIRGDCCPDIETTCPPVSSCSAAGYDTCCTDLSTGCVGVSTGAECYCDIGCRARGLCCDDINTTCPESTAAGSNFNVGGVAAGVVIAIIVIAVVVVVIVVVVVFIMKRQKKSEPTEGFAKFTDNEKVTLTVNTSQSEKTPSDKPTNPDTSEPVESGYQQVDQLNTAENKKDLGNI